jgi:hypothetical protein
MRNAKAPIAKRIAIIVASAVAIAVGPVWSTFHTFQIDELYSSPDGSVQFVELHEALGANGQHLLAGHALTSTQGATTRTYIFPTDLPNSSTAGKRVLIATPGFAGLGIVTPDYIIPAPFLFPGGGTLNYGGVDIITYPALPADGVSSLSRSGTVGTNSPTNYAGQTGSIAPPAPPTLTTGIPTLDQAMLAVLSALLVIATLVIRRFR